MQNVNIPETKKIKSVWTHEEKRRHPLKKNDGNGCTWEGKKGVKMARQHPGRYEELLNDS